MDKYFIDQPITITIPLTSNEVDAGECTSVVYTVSTIEPIVAQLVSDVFDPLVNTTGAITFTLSPIDIGIRSIIQIGYELVTAGDTFSYTIEFIAESVDQLLIGTNSYQTYFGALLIAEELSGIDNFKGATKAEQTTALAHAYRALNTLTYTDNTAEYYDLGTIGQTAMLALEAGFLQALRMAQIIEANEYLDPNSLYQKRQDGLLSETIGESSMMFRAGNILNFPVTRRSMLFLRNYTIIRAVLQRG